MRKYIEPHEYINYAQLGSALDVYDDKKKYPGKNTSLRMLLVRLKEGGLFDDVLTEARRKLSASKDSVTICIKPNLKARLERYRLELLQAPLGTYAIATFKLETKYHDLRSRTWPCYMTTDYVLVKDPQAFVEMYKKQLPDQKSSEGPLLAPSRSGDESLARRPSDTHLETSHEPTVLDAQPSNLLQSLQEQLRAERVAREAQDDRIKFLEGELKRAFARIDAERAALENFFEQTEQRLKKRKT